jgi:hypothetical protein
VVTPHGPARWSLPHSYHKMATPRPRMTPERGKPESGANPLGEVLPEVYDQEASRRVAQGQVEKTQEGRQRESQETWVVEPRDDIL